MDRTDSFPHPATEPAPPAVSISISGAVPAALAVAAAAGATGSLRTASRVRPPLECERRPAHAPAAQRTQQPDPEDVFADENDDFVWIDLERMLAGREAARRLHPSFRG
jgi:hypothetical protein